MMEGYIGIYIRVLLIVIMIDDYTFTSLLQGYLLIKSRLLILLLL